MEREELRNLFLLLRPELQDRDIPHRSTMHKCILQTYEEALSDLSENIEVMLYYFLYGD